MRPSSEENPRHAADDRPRVAAPAPEARPGPRRFGATESCGIRKVGQVRVDFFFRVDSEVNAE